MTLSGPQPAVECLWTTSFHLRHPTNAAPQPVSKPRPNRKYARTTGGSAASCKRLQRECFRRSGSPPEPHAPEQTPGGLETFSKVEPASSARALTSASRNNRKKPDAKPSDY